MLKRELIDKVSEELGDLYYKRDISMAIEIILEDITQALVDGRRVEIRGFGTFSTRNLNPKTFPNPKTGKQMSVLARKTSHFTMSKSLKEALLQD